MYEIGKRRLRFWLTILALVGVLSIQELEAGERSTPATVLSAAGGVDSLFQHPVTNMAKICVCLKGPSPFTDTIRTRILETKADDGSPIAKAALSYMKGEARYWMAFDRFRSLTSKTDVNSDARNIVGAYLNSWMLVRKADNAQKGALRRAIIGRLKTLFSTGIYGARLPPDLKEQVVETFIDHSEKERDGPKSWSCRERARIYLNLGIGDRVLSQLPKEIPDNPDSLRDAMLLAVGLKRSDQAVLFASALDNAHAEYLRRNVGVWYEVFRVYRDNGSPRTLGCIRAIAEKDPAGYLELYEVSQKLEVGIQEVERVRYLDRYVRLSSSTEESGPWAVSAAAQRLFRAEQYQGTVDFIDRHSPVSEGFRGAVLWQIKGRCYEQMGRRADAVKAYRRCVDLAEGTGYADRLTAACSKRLIALGAIEEKEVKKE